MVTAEAFVDAEARELILRARRREMVPGWAELAVPLARPDLAVVNAEDAPLCVLDAMRNAAAALLDWRGEREPEHPWWKKCSSP